MPSAGGFTQQHFFQRVSTSVFVILCLLLVPAATFACLLLGAMICASAGIDDHSTVQNRILWAAVLVGCLGSIFLLVRAERTIPSQVQFATIVPAAHPPVPRAANSDHATRTMDVPEHEIRSEETVEVDQSTTKRGRRSAARAVTPPSLPIHENEAIPEEDLASMEIDQNRTRHGRLVAVHQVTRDVHATCYHSDCLRNKDS